MCWMCWRDRGLRETGAAASAMAGGGGGGREGAHVGDEGDSDEQERDGDEEVDGAHMGRLVAR
jgi:hypothetical protein